MKLVSQIHTVLCAECKESLYTATEWYLAARRAIDHLIQEGHSTRIQTEALTLVTDTEAPPPMPIPSTKRSIELTKKYERAARGKGLLDV